MKLGISTCLLGENCRYDGSGCKDQFINKVLTYYFTLIPYCPESIIFGTPRESIRLIEEDEKIKVFTNQSKKDVIQELYNISKKLAEKTLGEELSGFIFKSKSPICGMERVKVYQLINAPSEKKRIGIFANEIRKLYPYLPIEEGRLNDPWLRKNFLKIDPQYRDLIEFHTSYKYLIYSKSHKAYKELGKVVANQDNYNFNKILKNYSVTFLKAMSEKGNIKKTYNILLHILGYFKKYITKEGKEHILNSCNEYKQGIIPLIAVIKLVNLSIKKFDEQYLQKQKFLNPYPAELGLRSDLRTFK